MRVLSAPVRVVWEVTRKCNLRCRYCYISASTAEADELTTREALDLCGQLIEMEVFHVTLSGGEPLTRLDVYDIISKLRQAGINVFLNSNGTLIDADIARRLKDAGVHGVAISLDGVTRETHEKVRLPRGSFERALRGIDVLRASEIPVGIQTTITTDNYHEMPELAAFCLERGLPGVKFSRVSPVGRGRDNYRELGLGYDEAMALVRELLQLRNEYRGRLRIDFGENLLSAFLPEDEITQNAAGLDEYVMECEAGRSKCSISPSGDVRPCEFFTTPEYFAGNIRENPFAAIWRNSEVFQYFRSDELYSGCTVCEKQCSGRCPAAAVAAGGHSADDPTCPYVMRAARV